MDIEHPKKVTTFNKCTELHFFSKPKASFNPSFEVRTTTLSTRAENVFQPNSGREIYDCWTELLRAIDSVNKELKDRET